MSYSDAGYQTFAGALPAKFITEARATLRGILGSITEEHPLWENIVPISQLLKHRNPGIPETQTERIPFIISELPKFSDFFRKFILHSALWDIAKNVLQSDSIVYHFSNITRKPAYIGPNLSWHRDYPNQFICPTDSRHFFRALIPLGSMNSQNGCTQVIANTHFISDLKAQKIKISKEKDFDPEWALDLKADPGDVIAIHSKLVHGGRENRSSEDRDLLVVQFGIPTDNFLYKSPELYSGFSQLEIQGEPGAAANP
jgi:ectoine hydroxylase-related dioxygenase (phytanoyl-CoA dioxygenase family)